MSFKAILAFEDGSVFHGKGFGKENMMLVNLFLIHL